MNDHCLGTEILKNPEGIISPNPQRVILFGVVLGLLMPPERQPFSMGSIGQLMADPFDWNPMRTLEETNRCLKLCAEDPHYNPDLSKDEFGLVHVRLPEALNFNPKNLDFKPLPTLRNIVAFAVAIALLVPEEKRRRADKGRMRKCEPVSCSHYGAQEARGTLSQALRARLRSVLSLRDALADIRNSI
jgi:hypothetical protein